MEYNYTKRVEQNFPCGCHIDEMIDGSYGIVYCSNHKAAPDMYEALKELREWLKSEDVQVLGRGFIEQFGIPKTQDKVDKALAKAEGK